MADDAQLASCMNIRTQTSCTAVNAGNVKPDMKMCRITGASPALQYAISDNIMK